MTFNAQNTVTDVKRLIGKKFSQIKDELNDWFCKIIEGENDTILLEVEYMSKKQTFTPVQILGMIFQRFKSFIQKETQDYTACSAVVSVPGFFTDEQRNAIIQACEIAQITVLRLINEASASALVYGVYNEDLTDEKPQTICIADIGHYNASFTLCRFTKSKFQVLGAEYAPGFGAGILEKVLYDYYVIEIQKKYKLDVLSNVKAQLRLKAGIDKLKKVLSANSSGQLRIECLMEDTDVTFNMERTFFEEMCAPHLKSLKKVVDNLFKNSGKEKILNSLFRNFTKRIRLSSINWWRFLHSAC
jgi:heat shock 70kDa protein 4